MITRVSVQERSMWRGRSRSVELKVDGKTETVEGRDFFS